MKLREWKYWFKHQPFQKKWFLYFILIRPFIDPFYELKEISPIASPLYIVGVLTPVFIAYSLISYKSSRINIRSKSFALFSFFLIVNCLILLFEIPTLSILGDVLKYLTIFFIFYYIKKLFNSERDLHGILTTFLISAIFPVMIILYEFIFGPFNPQILSDSRGGGARAIGFYADIFNYAIYLVGTFLISGYFYFRKQIYGIKFFGLNPLLVTVIVLIGLISIKHVASWFVLGSLIILLWLLQLKTKKELIAFLFLFGLVIPFLAQTIYETQVNPLIQKEFLVIEGTAPLRGAFNGRMFRWLNYYDWWSDMNTFSQFFGVSSSGFEKARLMVSGQTHNDYIRLFFLTGFPGILFYLSFLIGILRIGLKMQSDKLFLIAGSVFVILLYSFSSLPSLYSSLLYLIIPIFVHALTLEKAYLRNGKKVFSPYPRQAAAAVFRSGGSNRNNPKFKAKRRLQPRSFQYKVKPQNRRPGEV